MRERRSQEMASPRLVKRRTDVLPVRRVDIAVRRCWAWDKLLVTSYCSKAGAGTNAPGQLVDCL